MKRVKKKAALAALVCGVLGVSLIALGLYLAPSEAYELQAPFRQFGESTTGIVVSTGTSTRAYVAGGRRGGAREYEENVVTLQLPSEGGRTVQIAHLVLDADMERLVPGASVAVTFVRGEGARQLRQGPYYLLTSSVEASPIGLLGWAFDGRPSRGRAIAGYVSGFVLLMFAVVFIIIARDKGIGAAPPRRMLFDWEPIDREEPASSDYGDNANFYVTPTQGPYNNSTVSALFRLHPLPGGFVTTWRSFCVARNDDGTERWRVNGWGKHLDVSPDGTRVALTQEGGGSVAIVDARSGQLLHTTEPLAKHLSQLAWSADGQRIVVLTSGEILRVDAQRGTLLNRFTELPGGENPVLTSVVRSPDGRFIVSHPNAKLLLVLDETTGEITAVEEKFAGNLFLGPSGKFLWIGQTSGVYTDTLPDLAEAGWFKMPGKLGIRAADQQDDFAYIQFQPIPRAALDDKVVLLNDRTGQLWLTSGGKGVAYHTWPREVLDGVEDTLWVGEDVFLVATNDRHIRRMSFYSYQPEWEVKDG